MFSTHSQFGLLVLAALFALSGTTVSQENDFSGVYNFVEISDRLSTSGQISLDDIEVVDAAGFGPPRPSGASERLDAIALHKLWGPLLFLAVVVMVFQSIFQGMALVDSSSVL